MRCSTPHDDVVLSSRTACLSPGGILAASIAGGWPDDAHRRVVPANPLSPQPRAPGGGARGRDERPPRDDGRAGTIRQHAAAARTRARCLGMELARRPGARSAVRGAGPAAHARLHDRRHPVAGARLRADRHRCRGRQRLPAAHAAIPRGRSALSRPLRAAGPLGAARHDRPGLGLGAGRRRISHCFSRRVVLPGRRRLRDGVAGIAGVEGVHRRPGGLGRRRATAVGRRFHRRGRPGRPHRSRALAGSVCRQSGRDRPVAAHRVGVPPGNARRASASSASSRRTSTTAATPARRSISWWRTRLRSGPTWSGCARGFRRRPPNSGSRTRHGEPPRRRFPATGAASSWSRHASGGLAR